MDRYILENCLYKNGKKANVYNKLDAEQYRETTHVIMPVDYFINLNSEREEYKRKIADYESKINETISNFDDYKTLTNFQIEEYKKTVKQNETLSFQINQLKKNEIINNKILSNFKRIAKERANVYREQENKKTSSGYIIRRITSFDYKYKDVYFNTSGIRTIYKTLIITPYESTMEMEIIQQLVISDLKNKDNLKNPIYISEENIKIINKRIDEISIGKNPEYENMFFHFRAVINTQNKYWEVELLSFKPINCIPKNFTINYKKNSSSK